jgi:hypothetical protein
VATLLARALIDDPHAEELLRQAPARRRRTYHQHAAPSEALMTIVSVIPDQAAIPRSRRCCRVPAHPLGKLPSGAVDFQAAADGGGDGVQVAGVGADD